MCFAARSGIACDRRPSTDFARCRDREDIRLSLIVLDDVFLANIVGGEDRNERGGARSFFDVWPAFRLFPLDEAHCCDNLESKLPRSLDRLDRRSPGGADIIDYEYGSA